jgi:hypothetical protein
VHCVAEDTKDDGEGGEWWEEEEYGNEDDYVVYSNDMLNLENAMEYGKE